MSYGQEVHVTLVEVEVEVVVEWTISWSKMTMHLVGRPCVCCRPAMCLPKSDLPTISTVTAGWPAPLPLLHQTFLCLPSLSSPPSSLIRAFILIYLVWFVWMNGTGQSIWRACKRPGERSTRRGNRVMLVCSDLSQLLQSVAASTLLLGSLSKPFWAPLLFPFSLLACSLCTQSSYKNLFDVLSSPPASKMCAWLSLSIQENITP